MKRSLQSVPLILTLAALVAITAATAGAESAAPVLLAKFVGALNTKAAKTGDAVVATTEKPAKMADGREIPKGSLIRGKVAAVTSKTGGNGNSTLAIKFDEIEVKGVTLPIEGQILAIGHHSETNTPDT